MITEEQRAARQSRIGSSDCAAIMGLDPYRSAYDVWLEKTGRSPGFKGNAATARGNWLEASLMAFAEDRLGLPIKRNQTHLDAGGILAANLDGEIAEISANVEGKSLSGKLDANEWGDVATDPDRVPDRVVIQCHAAMICAKLTQSFIPVVLPAFGQYDWRMYRLPFSQKIADSIRRDTGYFWKNYVLADVPPEGSTASPEVLKRLRRVPKTVAKIPQDLVERWIVASAAAKQVASVAKAAKEEADAAQAAILAAMNPIDADGAITDGGLMLEYFETRKRAYSVDATSYRTLRLSKTQARPDPGEPNNPMPGHDEMAKALGIE